MATLVLSRYAAWNLSQQPVGGVGVDLSDEGCEQVVRGGRLLRQARLLRTGRHPLARTRAATQAAALAVDLTRHDN